MAQPKRKTSKSRRDKRRTFWKATVPTVTLCPNCKEPKLPHRACPNCGYYRGRPVMMVKEK
ncbi:MAG: 50S ribosomal protein L32 [Candidatus Neomarinimicrobiota bacterium]|nr:50S ribosomal protein L32 [Candidatus Neomarinimicrobiota bacterium]MCD6100506.1 50S ribosomal protein L32 [Candidatus Neomarinimicrobiota bacterium]RKY45975.1 MAG: 50S ribosomal protein L32 [Candidatus Neomarinimicrobiota bacterium]RKY52350.1 MAG: 50S ribosomal protein L32 [Candidatus Neomarinimicrobiota bacterium]HDN58978.1 50S ribosomal protein L32 [Candidatus Neomarinimicrobiota bacterium]